MASHGTTKGGIMSDTYTLARAWLAAFWIVVLWSVLAMVVTWQP